jgi:hypothetical protein
MLANLWDDPHVIYNITFEMIPHVNLQYTFEMTPCNQQLKKWQKLIKKKNKQI